MCGVLEMVFFMHCRAIFTTLIERIILTLVNGLGIRFNNEQYSSQHLLTLVNVKYFSLLVHNESTNVNACNYVHDNA